MQLNDLNFVCPSGVKVKAIAKGARRIFWFRVLEDGTVTKTQIGRRFKTIDEALEYAYALGWTRQDRAA